MNGNLRALLGVGLVLFGTPLAYMVAGPVLAALSIFAGVALFTSGVGLDGRDLS